MQGHDLLAANGGVIRAGAALPAGNGQAYNLTVANVHTYFVGQQETLVHNMYRLPGSGVIECPATAEAYTIAQRVLTKGSPFPGFEGGRVFLNGDNALPRLAPGESYRE